eukprot:5778824-Lingulodinium_polyedra.AAC.1
MGKHRLKGAHLGQTDAQRHIQAAAPGQEGVQRGDGLGGDCLEVGLIQDNLPWDGCGLVGQAGGQPEQADALFLQVLHLQGPHQAGHLANSS